MFPLRMYTAVFEIFELCKHTHTFYICHKNMVESFFIPDISSLLKVYNQNNLVGTLLFLNQELNNCFFHEKWAFRKFISILFCCTGSVNSLFLIYILITHVPLELWSFFLAVGFCFHVCQTLGALWEAIPKCNANGILVWLGSSVPYTNNCIWL